MFDERRNIRGAFAKRRERYADDIESIIEILSESPLFNTRQQVPVRCGDDSNVERSVLVTSNATDLSTLKRSQKTRLQIQRQLADLVDEERPSLGGLEHADVLPVRACEGPALVAEEMTLD